MTTERVEGTMKQIKLKSNWNWCSNSKDLFIHLYNRGEKIPAIESHFIAQISENKELQFYGRVVYKHFKLNQKFSTKQFY